jgi:hypothetical protein
VAVVTATTRSEYYPLSKYIFSTHTHTGIHVQFKCDLNEINILHRRIYRHARNETTKQQNPTTVLPKVLPEKCHSQRCRSKALVVEKPQRDGKNADGTYRQIFTQVAK